MGKFPEIKFIPIDGMLRRVESSKDDSDIAYVYDLLALGEMLTKIISIFLVENIDDDVERTRYRFEYKLVHANGVGEFSDTISQVLTGNTANTLLASISDEVRELTKKSDESSWQRIALDRLDQVNHLLNIESNKISNKSSLSQWFLNFAILRNKTKGHGSITGDACSRICAPLAESILIILENSLVFKYQWACIRPNLSGSYRITRLTESSVDFDFLKKKNNGLTLLKGVYCFTNQLHFMPLISSPEPDKENFFLPNGGFSNKKYESLDYVSDDHIFVDGSGFLRPPTTLLKSNTSGKDILRNNLKSYTNIPEKSIDYISRPELETDLKSLLLNEERFPIITLKGRGGIGKTSLAVKVVNDEAITSNFDMIVWFSARDMDLFPEGPKPVQANVINQKDIAREYFHLIDPNNVPPKDAVDKLSIELGSNNYGRSLFIFDNFETLTNPIEIYEWLNTNIRNPNKILITSRMNRNFKADYPIEIGGMREDECKELIRLAARKLNIEGLLTNNYIQKLIDESDGHPYIIKIVLGDIAKERELLNVRKIVGNKVNILEALFKRTYSTLSHAAKRVFLTLCSWNSVVPLIALESILTRHEDDDINIENATEELCRSSFVETIENEGELFLTVPLAAALFGRNELSISVDKQEIDKDRRLLMEFGAGTIKGNTVLETYIQRKFKAVAFRIQTKEDLLREMPMLEVLASRSPKSWLLIADMYNEYNISEQELYALNEYIKTNPTEEESISTWMRIAGLYKILDNWKGESMAYETIIGLKSVSYDLLSKMAKRVNTYYNSQDITGANELKNRLSVGIVNIMESRIDEADATDLSRMAWLCLNIKDVASAWKFTELGLEREPNNIHCIRLHERLSNTE